jgi:hypothetical protein
VQWGGLELGLGNTDAVIEVAQVELTEQPFAEPLTELLMRALDAAGRGTEALRVYAATRAQLVDELGAEPGPALARLHQEILRRDAPSPVPVPAQLPPDTHGFVGRRAELAELTDVLLTRPVPIVAVTGIGGVGKTALAVRWAARVRCRFPDGQLYVNLRVVILCPAVESQHSAKPLALPNSTSTAGGRVRPSTVKLMVSRKWSACAEPLAAAFSRHRKW